SVVSAQSGQLTLRVFDEHRVLGASPPITVGKGSNTIDLSVTVTIPPDSTKLCQATYLFVGTRTLVVPADPAVEAPLCYPLVVPNDKITSVTGGWIGDVIKGQMAAIDYQVGYALESPRAEIVLVVSDQDSRRVVNDVSVPVNAGTGTVTLNERFQVPPNTRILCPAFRWSWRGNGL